MAFTINLTDILGAQSFGQSRLDINNNFLTLKDTIEDLFNGFSIDVVGNKFGTSLLDISAKSVNVINGKYKMTYTQGSTDITRDILSITGLNLNEITLDNIDNLTVNIGAFINNIDANEITISNTGSGLINAGLSTLTGPVLLGSSLKESLVDVNITLTSAGEGTLNINANTQNNLFLVLDASLSNSATNFNINPVIAASTPDGLVFTIYLKDITGFTASPTPDIYIDRDKVILSNSGDYKLSEVEFNSAITCMVINPGTGQKIIVKSVHNLE